MTVWMGYTRLTTETSQADIQAILYIFGNDALCGWLEDPMDTDGLAMREDIDPAVIVPRADGILVPEVAGTDDEPTPQRLWPQGRLFNEWVDVRWEKLSHHLHLVVITEKPLTAPFEGIIDRLMEIDDNVYTLMLWGTYGANEGWREGRIPHLNRFYPGHWSGPRAAIETRIYEAEWHYSTDALPSARNITRYLRYVGNYKPPQDPRFTED